MKFLKKERGFSLIEVVASIVIITIVLLSFSQLFIQSNRIAYKNNEKLVTINLADAMLAKAQANVTTPGQTIDNYFTDLPLEIELNGRSYKIKYEPSQSTEKALNSSYSEAQLNLIKVVVTVSSPDAKTKGSTEGYVSIE